MSYRRILVPIFGCRDDGAAIGAALSLGRQFGAHVQALLVRRDPVSAVPYGYAGITSGYAAQYAVEAAIKASDAAQAVALEMFAKAVEKFGVEVNERPRTRADVTSHLKIVHGDFADEVERESRLCDIIVFCSSDQESGQEQVREGFEAALLSGSRPVVYFPREPVEIAGQHVAIAYDGSAAAAHAVTAALPFISRAKSVHCIEVTSVAGKSAALAELRGYLELHGIDAVEHTVDPSPKSTADALVLAVQGQRCDLLVLGGYGHSRIREFVLGGVTRYVLRHELPFAVLMAH